MTANERALLLTVARLFRARISGGNPNARLLLRADAEDLADLNEALRPFDPLPGAPINQASREPYGYCPSCGAIGVERERRPSGNDRCFNGHVYPSAAARAKPLWEQIERSAEYAASYSHG